MIRLPKGACIRIHGDQTQYVVGGPDLRLPGTVVLDAAILEDGFIKLIADTTIWIPQCEIKRIVQ